MRKSFAVKTVRWAMQTLGTEWGRQIIGEDLWINAWKQTASTHLMSSISNRVVVDDCRFQNEVEIILKLGGTIHEITRPSHKEIETSDHSSENPIAQKDLKSTFINVAGIEEFKNLIRSIFNPKEKENAKT